VLRVVFAVNHKVPDISFPAVGPFSLELMCMLFTETLFTPVNCTMMQVISISSSQ